MATKRKSPTIRPFDEMTFPLIRDWFEETYGHGWKRRFAETAGVPETTVHSWLKSEKFPPWVMMVFRLLVQKSQLRRDVKALSGLIEDFAKSGHIVQSDDGYAVYRFEDGIGKLVARGITDVETAKKIASLPRLEALLDRGSDFAFVLGEDAEDDLTKDEIDEFLNEKQTWCRIASLSYEREWPKFAKLLGDAVSSLVEEVGKSTNSQGT